LNPENGLKQAWTITDEKMREKFMSQIGIEWARRDTINAGKWAIDMLNQGQRINSSGAIDAIIGRWIQWDHQAPFERIDEISDPFERQQTLYSAIGMLSIYNPKAAALKLANALDLSSTDGANTVKRVVNNWIAKDSIEASTWVRNLSQGPAKDASIIIILDNLLSNKQSVDMARMWAEEILDPSLRNKQINRINARNN